MELVYQRLWLARTWTTTVYVWIDNSSYTNHHGSRHYRSREFVEALPADATVECDAVPTAPTLNSNR
jgi:hypothetical protein